METKALDCEDASCRCSDDCSVLAKPCGEKGGFRMA